MKEQRTYLEEVRKLSDKMFFLNMLNNIDIPEGTEFYHWAYDDGSEVGVAIDDKSDDAVLSKTYSSREERRAEQKRIKEKNEKQKFDFEKNKLTVKTGIENVKTNRKQFYKENSENTLNSSGDAFLKLLTACGQDLKARQEVIKLVSGILSGYTFSFFIEMAFPVPQEPVSVLHAPILGCAKKTCEDFLEAAARALIVDTAPTDEDKPTGLIFKQPCTLPARIYDKRTADSAYIRLRTYDKKPRKEHYPAQYRESAVYVKSQFFAQRDLLDFQRRNCWATIVMSSTSEPIQLIPAISLDHKILANYAFEENWDEETVRDLATFFVIWFRKYRKKCDPKIERKEFQRYSDAIAQSNRKHGTEKIRGLKALWLQVQLRSMDLFAQFAEENGIWSKEDCRYLASQWKNLLLPSICPQPEPVSPIAMEQAVILPEADGEHLFQNVLSNMLAKDNWQQFCRVAASGLFPRFKDSKQILGYVRVYRDNKEHCSFFALQIREKDFCQEANSFSNIKCDWYEIIKSLRKVAPPYLHPSKTCRMPDAGETGSPCPAIVLKIDQLDFLSESAEDFLLNLALLN